MDDFGRVGWEWIVGRLETGRGLERVFAVVEMVGAALRLAVVGGGMFEMLLVPKTEPVARRSLEADVRSRGVLASPGPVGAAARLSLDGARRRGMPVGLGAGRRDIGLGRPLVLPAGSLLSSMAVGLVSRSSADFGVAMRRLELLGLSGCSTATRMFTAPREGPQRGFVGTGRQMVAWRTSRR